VTHCSAAEKNNAVRAVVSAPVEWVGWKDNLEGMLCEPLLVGKQQMVYSDAQDLAIPQIEAVVMPMTALGS
jgi:hypothetical protein